MINLKWGWHFAANIKIINLHRTSHDFKSIKIFRQHRECARNELKRLTCDVILLVLNLRLNWSKNGYTEEELFRDTGLLCQVNCLDCSKFPIFLCESIGTKGDRFVVSSNQISCGLGIKIVGYFQITTKVGRDSSEHGNRIWKLIYGWSACVKSFKLGQFLKSGWSLYSW